MSPSESVVPAPKPPRHAGIPGLVAAAIIGLEALGCAGFAVFFLPAASEGASLSGTSHLMFSLVTVLFAVGLALVARGLWLGRGWPRTAAVVWFALLMPVGWALLQAGRGLAGVLVLGSAAAGIGAVAAETRSAARP